MLHTYCTPLCPTLDVQDHLKKIHNTIGAKPGLSINYSSACTIGEQLNDKPRVMPEGLLSTEQPICFQEKNKI